MKKTLGILMAVMAVSGTAQAETIADKIAASSTHWNSVYDGDTAWGIGNQRRRGNTEAKAELRFNQEHVNPAVTVPTSFSADGHGTFEVVLDDDGLPTGYYTDTVVTHHYDALTTTLADLFTPSTETTFITGSTLIADGISAGSDNIGNFHYQTNSATGASRIKLRNSDGTYFSDEWAVANNVNDLIVNLSKDVFASGFNAGFESGYKDGFSDGYNEGFIDGYELGHQRGYFAGQNSN